MKIFRSSQAWLLAVAALLPLSSACRAEIYKWVDANGRTHYLENPEAAGSARVTALREAARPAAPSNAGADLPDWQEKDRLFRQRQAQKLLDTANQPQAAARPKSLSGGRSGDTDASKCNLARDVLSGAVVHRNGAPTDKYDRYVAGSDVRTYCR